MVVYVYLLSRGENENMGSGRFQAFSGSLIPPVVMIYVASRSGQSTFIISIVSTSVWEKSYDLPGESTTLATRSSPRPFRRRILVVDACARICPPAGLRPSAPAKRALAPGSDIT